MTELEELRERVERLEQILADEQITRLRKPTLEQVKAYVLEKDYFRFDAEDFFLKKEGRAWEGVKNWKRTIDNWNRRGWCHKEIVRETKSVQEMFGV